jgi:hypothetical protein
MAADDEGPSVQFSISLPAEALDMIENGLKHFGLYGKRRATIAARLICDALKTRAVMEQVREGRAKAEAAKTAESPRPRSPKGRTSRTDRP